MCVPAPRLSLSTEGEGADLLADDGHLAARVAVGSLRPRSFRDQDQVRDPRRARARLVRGCSRSRPRPPPGRPILSPWPSVSRATPRTRRHRSRAACRRRAPRHRTGRPPASPGPGARVRRPRARSTAPDRGGEVRSGSPGVAWRRGLQPLPNGPAPCGSRRSHTACRRRWRRPPAPVPASSSVPRGAGAAGAALEGRRLGVMLVRRRPEPARDL